MSVLKQIGDAIKAAKTKAESPENIKSGKTELVFDSLTNQIHLVTGSDKRIFLKHNHVKEDGRYCAENEINAYFTPEQNGETVNVIEVIQKSEDLEAKVSKQDKEIAKLKKQLAEQSKAKEPVKKAEPAKDEASKAEK